MYKVYGDLQSGNCYKIKLLMSLLSIEYEWIHVDILAGDTRAEAFERVNKNRKIPVLQIDDQTFLSESNAILNYLADGSDFLPATRLGRARVLEWQFFEQYSHEPFIAVARFINKYLGLPEDRLEEYQAKQSGGHKALTVMEKQLALTPYLTGEQPTIADISLYAYTHVADEGGFDLSGYPAIGNWIARIQRLPSFVSM